jgi:hypothetical protein
MARKIESTQADGTAAQAVVNRMLTGAPASRLRGAPERRFGAAAAGTAPLHEPEPGTPCRRPALRRQIPPLVAMSRCAPLKMQSRLSVDKVRMIATFYH